MQRARVAWEALLWHITAALSLLIFPTMLLLPVPFPKPQKTSLHLQSYQQYLRSLIQLHAPEVHGVIMNMLFCGINNYGWCCTIVGSKQAHWICKVWSLQEGFESWGVMMMHATIVWCATTYSGNFHLMQCPTFLSVAIDLPSILHVLSFLTFFEWVVRKGGFVPFVP